MRCRYVYVGPVYCTEDINKVIGGKNPFMNCPSLNWGTIFSDPDISPPPFRRRTFRHHRFAAGHFATTVSPPDISPPPFRRHRFDATDSPPDQNFEF
ncbi:unnamed protein product [Macrosiphum euphorbiae]|uniref:Uncharacterized protein n=1 Tax=Macrosiphum euphorbiae TaxID=13131 RepID=A0AAV0XV59_9HEMI|nr:unnamed protein product [Macrosiphum euphorbiae]